MKFKNYLTVILVFFSCIVFSQTTSNDECSNATTLQVNDDDQCTDVTNVTFTNATVSSEDNSCADTNSGDLWYQFTATSNTHQIEIVNPNGGNLGSTFDEVVLTLYSGTCSGLTELYCTSLNNILATDLEVGVSYLLRVTDNSTAVNATNFDLCVNVPELPANVDSFSCAIRTINSDFESPVVTGIYPPQIDQDMMQGWRTTATSGLIEVWPVPNFEDVPGFSGSQFVELNADEDAGIYQDYETPLSTSFTYSFVHRARAAGFDVCQILSGPPGGPYEVVDTFSTNNAAWVYYSGNYTSPDSQPITRFIFEAVSTAGGDPTVGNFLDAVSITANNGILTENPYTIDCSNAEVEVEAAGGGNWIAADDNPGETVIVDPNSNTTTISGFSVPGIYHYTWNGTYCVSDLEVVFQGFNLSFSYGEDAVCQGSENLSPILADGFYEGGTFTSEDGLVIDATTGEVNVTDSTPGTYNITYTIVPPDDVETECDTSNSYEITIGTVPEISAIEDYVLCGETPNEGYANFNLTSKEDEILNGQTGVEVTYYYTAEDAENATDAFSVPQTYENEEEFQQTIYVRLEETNSGCYSTTSFNIVVNMLPEVTEIEDLYICDDGSGTVTLDLNTQLTQILNGQSTDDFTASVYENEADALAATNAISSIDAYEIPSESVATLYVRVENTINSDCYATTSFTVNSYSTPVINQPEDILECLSDDSGIASFDTSGVTESIIGDMEGVSIQYFDEDGNLIGDELPNPYESASQTITANVTDSYSVCYEFQENDFTLNGNAQMLSDDETIRLTPNQSGQNGSAWADIMLDLSEDFTVESEMYFGNNDAGADGMAFVIQPLSVNAGSLGGGLGFAGISPSFAVEFDTYDNGVSVDPISSDHIALIQDGNPQNVAAHSAITPYYNAGNLEDGAWHSAIFHWDVEAQTFTVTFDGSLVINVTIDITNEVFDGSPYVYWGFTGATGAAYNLQQVRVLDYCVAQEDIGCTASVEFDLIASHALEVGSLDTIEVCDDSSNNGIESFDLTQYETEIFNGYEDDFTISYYTSEEDAIASNNAIANPSSFNNTVQGGQTIYIRLDNNDTSCVSFASFDIQINPVPEVIVPYPYYGCDQDEDGYYDYDLPSMNAEILNGQTNVSVSYYATLADAQLATNALPNMYTNSQTPDETIYARLENTITGCYNTTTLELKIAYLPETLAAGSLEECDIDHDGFAEFDIESINNGILPNNGQQYYISYHETYEDAEDGENTISSMYQNITPDQQTIYIRIEHAVSGCFSIEPLELIVNPTPPNDVVLDALTYCDPDNDGFGSFDIESMAEAAITDSSANYEVSFFETYIDATTATNELTSMYDNIVPYLQTIYIRLTWDVNSCVSVIPLDLIVQNTPVVSANLPDLEICDDSVVDGLAEFDLTLENDAVYVDQSTSDFSISYYETEAEALLGENSLPLNYTNVNPYQQTIYVRLENNTTGCFTVRAFDLLVHENPVINPNYDYDLALCDDFGEEGDETLVFDLTWEKDEITGDVGGYSVHFFESMSDAQNNVNEIPDDTAYTNYANPQNLYVRVEDVITGCTTFTTVTLRVLNNPTPLAAMEPLEACDDDLDGDENNGQVVFDLTQDELALLNGESGVSATYYESYEDAFEGANAIANPEAYYNVSSYNQTIYVGVTNDVTGCLTIVDFDLIVHPLPEVTDANFFYVCELDNNDIEKVLLTDMDSFVVDGGSLDGLEINYYATEAAAEAGYPMIIGPYVDVYGTLEMYARVEDLETGCIQVVAYTMDIEQAPLAATPGIYAVCESLTEDGYYNNDGVEIFDLTSLESTILMGQDPNGYTVTFYETYDNALAQISPIIDEDAAAYESESTFIYAVVTNNTTGCTNGEPIEIELLVEPMPEVTLEIVNDGVVCIDATNNPVIGTDLGFGYTYLWSNGATTPTIEVTQGGDYYVTITTSESVNQCSYTTNTVTYEEASLPSVTPTIIQSEIFSDNNTIEVLANGAGVSTYEYQLDDNIAQDSNIFTNVEPGVHTVTIIEVNGCGSLSIEVSVIDYMKYFTPNGDGVNDKWRIIGLESQENAIVFIFDRQGKLLKQMSATSQGWDGMYNGVLMPSNDYWFKVVYTESSTGEVREFQSHFSLKL